MTRKPVGRISFVGAGPGDPSLLTRRAFAALTGADQVVYDADVPAALVDAVRAEAAADSQFSPAEGIPGDAAKVLLSAARSGLRAVRLVSGYARSAGLATSIIIRCADANRASRHVAEAAGYRQVGRMPQAEPVGGGELSQLILYAQP